MTIRFKGILAPQHFFRSPKSILCLAFRERQHKYHANAMVLAKSWRVTKKDSGHSDLSPYGVKCRRQDLNLHSHYRNQALKLLCVHLPRKAYMLVLCGISFRC
jgi:hypothetical protein